MVALSGLLLALLLLSSHLLGLEEVLDLHLELHVAEVPANQLLEHLIDKQRQQRIRQPLLLQHEPFERDGPAAIAAARLGRLEQFGTPIP